MREFNDKLMNNPKLTPSLKQQTYSHTIAGINPYPANVENMENS